MSIRLGIMSVSAGLTAALISLSGCKDKDSAADRAGERAEEAAEQRVEAEGGDVIDKQIAGEVAERRGELAVDTGHGDKQVKDLEDRKAETTAKDLNEPGGAH
jgi:hypothetical protein